MNRELLMNLSFQHDLWELPRADQKKVLRALKQVLKDPFIGGGKAKKIFKQIYSNIYRYRIGDYRIIYSVGEAFLKLLAVGNRKNIYDRFHADPDDLLEPKCDPASAEPQPIQTVHFDEPVAREPLAGEDTFVPNETTLAEEASKNHRLLAELLEQWNVPEYAIHSIINCSGVEEILELDIPDDVKDRVLRWNEPSSVNEIMEEPVYQLPSVEDLESYLDGTLKGFLLKLDPDQERVARKSLHGPTLVKGGPGTGKSLVALYRIRNLLEPDAQRDLFGGSRPRILFVTYTKALIRASEQLLEPLLGDFSKYVTVRNLDKIVRWIIGQSGSPFNPASDEQKRNALDEAADLLSQGEGTDKEALRQLLSRLRRSSLIDEFDWVIEGREIPNLDAYLQEDRTGRGIRLDRRARSVLWELYSQYTTILKENERTTFNLLRAQALTNVTQGKVNGFEPYDVVIVDEAQDLTPVALRLCLALCRDAEGLYMTADAGQSIYNRGFSWKRVHDAIQVRGRTTILKYNYRSTRQIAEAALQPLAESGTGDPDTTTTIPVREGPKPLLLRCTSQENQARQIAEFLKTAAQEVRLPLHAGAVLVRNNRTADQIAEGLRSQGLPATAVRGDTLDLEEKAIKVMTIHSAKGLEFPFVAVARVDQDLMPRIWHVKDPEDREARLAYERRLLSVALSRAMRRLALTYDLNNPSSFIGELDPALWTFEETQKLENVAF